MKDDVCSDRLCRQHLKVCNTSSFASGTINAASLPNRLQSLVFLQRTRDDCSLQLTPSASLLVVKQNSAFQAFAGRATVCERVEKYEHGIRQQVECLRLGVKEKTSDCSCCFGVACLSACQRRDFEVMRDRMAVKEIKSSCRGVEGRPECATVDKNKNISGLISAFELSGAERRSLDLGVPSNWKITIFYLFIFFPPNRSLHGLWKLLRCCWGFFLDEYHLIALIPVIG